MDDRGTTILREITAFLNACNVLILSGAVPEVEVRKMFSCTMDRSQIALWTQWSASSGSQPALRRRDNRSTNDYRPRGRVKE